MAERPGHDRGALRIRPQPERPMQRPDRDLVDQPGQIPPRTVRHDALPARRRDAHACAIGPPPPRLRADPTPSRETSAAGTRGAAGDHVYQAQPVEPDDERFKETRFRHEQRPVGPGPPPVPPSNRDAWPERVRPAADEASSTGLPLAAGARPASSLDNARAARATVRCPHPCTLSYHFARGLAPQRPVAQRQTTGSPNELECMRKCAADRSSRVARGHRIP